MPNLNRLLQHSYQLDTDLVGFEINRQLRELFPGRAILATQDYKFDLVAYAEEGACALFTLEDLDPFVCASWHGREKGVHLSPKHTFCEILWNGERLQSLAVTIDSDDLMFIISDRPEVGLKFFEAVCT